MSQYDGPSFFRQDHPKVEPIKQKKQTAPKQPRYELPKNVRTRTELKDEAREHLQTRKTPSTTIPHDPPPERFPFKNKHIPTSLQKRGGVQQTNVNTEVYAAIQTHLEKSPNSYLLFEGYLSDEMQTQYAVEKEVSSDREMVKEIHVSDQPVVEEPVVEIKKEATKSVMKPGAGLHRSLSNIMAEEQLGIQKSKQKLNRLFQEDEKKK